MNNSQTISYHFHCSHISADKRFSINQRKRKRGNAIRRLGRQRQPFVPLIRNKNTKKRENTAAQQQQCLFPCNTIIQYILHIYIFIFKSRDKQNLMVIILFELFPLFYYIRNEYWKRHVFLNVSEIYHHWSAKRPIYETHKMIILSSLLLLSGLLSPWYKRAKYISKFKNSDDIS